MSKCHAFAQEGLEYFCDRKQSGARVNGAINSAVVKVGKMKNRQMGDFDAAHKSIQAITAKLFFFSPPFKCFSICIRLHSSA